jgi:hypothetical protein
MDVQRNVRVQQADATEASWSSGSRSTTNVLRFSDHVRSQPHVQVLLERIDQLLGPIPGKPEERGGDIPDADEQPVEP